MSYSLSRTRLRFRQIAFAAVLLGGTAAEAQQVTGTAFFVSGDHLLTSAQLTKNCRSLMISEPGSSVHRTARIVATDAANDLALLTAPGMQVATPAPLQARVDQGETIFVMGFAAGGKSAASAEMTSGLVEAANGPTINAQRVQITGPMRDGHAGAPVINEWAQVVGIASLEASRKTSNAAASFVTKTAAAVAFLETHKIPVTIAPLDTTGLFGPDIARRAQAFTVQLICTKTASVARVEPKQAAPQPQRAAAVYQKPLIHKPPAQKVALASAPERPSIVAPRNVMLSKISWYPDRFVEGDGDVAILRHVSRAQCERACLTQIRCRLVEHYRPSGECGLFSRVVQSADGYEGDVGVKTAAPPRR